MAERLPIVFRKSPPYTANFDWIDTTTGYGYRKYYGGLMKDQNGTLHYFLTTRQVGASSGDRYATFTITGAGTTETISLDITVNNPVTIAEATAFINLTYNHTLVGNLYPTCEVFHVRGAAETSLGSGTAALTAASGSHRRGVFISLTKKFFAKDDILRIKVSFTYTGASSDTLKFYLDPASALTLTDIADSATINTDMTADIPFEVVL